MRALLLVAALALLVAQTGCSPAQARSVGYGSSAAAASAVGWDATQWSTITRAIGNQVTDYAWTDFTNPNEYDITQGDHPCAQLSPRAGGILKCPNGNSGVAYVGMAGQSSNAATVRPIANQKTSAWASCTRIKITVAPVSGTTLWLASAFGGDNSETETFLELKGSISTTVLNLVQDNFASITRTAANAAGTIGSGIILGNQTDYCVINDVTNGKVYGYVNGTLVATSSNLTNAPTAASVNEIVVSGAQGILEVDAMLIAWSRAQ
jgi:hypothetical protein